MLIKRKCSICKDMMEVTETNVLETVLYYKSQYFHVQCYINDKLGKKRNKLTQEQWMDKVRQYQLESKDYFANIAAKDALYRWIQSSYYIVSLPSYVFTKLDSIYNGTYKGLAQGIPPTDILDMWQRKKNELDKIAEFNKRKGNEIQDAVSRINYDLAVIINKYDSYLQWKEKQKLATLDNQQINKNYNNRIDFTNINKQVENNKHVENIDEIDSLLDELF